MIGKNLTRSEWYTWQIEKSALEDKLKSAESRLAAVQADAELMRKALEDGCDGCRVGEILVNQGPPFTQWPYHANGYGRCTLTEKQRAALLAHAELISEQQG